MKARKIFYKEYMEKHMPKPPRCVYENIFKRLLGIPSPSLCYIVSCGGKGRKAAEELAEYDRKLMRYLCYKRELNKEQWKRLYRVCRKERKEDEEL